MRDVFVNGVQVRKNSEHTGATPGQVVRGPAASPNDARRRIRATECGCPDPRWRCYRAGLRAHLLRAGRSVTILEQGTAAAACSHGNCGTITPSHAMPLAMPGQIGQALRWLFKRDAPFRVAPRLGFTLLEWLLQFAHRCMGRLQTRPRSRHHCSSSRGGNPRNWCAANASTASSRRPAR